MSNSNTGKSFSKEVNKLKGNSNKNHPNWKGGYDKKNIPLYNTYAPQIEWCEEVRQSSRDGNILEIRCTYCNKWYQPSRSNIRNRIKSLNTNKGNSRLYCSDSCKNNCDIYGQIKYPKGYMVYYTREVQPALRKLVLERDNWICQKCNNEENLHCHHIDPVINNPIESADIDNCVTLCKYCHKETHKQSGCKYSELRC